MSVTIAVAGGGLMGRQHIRAIAESGAARLHAVIDPAPAARPLAEEAGAQWFPDLSAALGASPPPQGVILATPNRMHVEQALACLGAGVPVLVEKPLATSAAEGAR
ncbi:MAG: gfo/Idh/MocA family oxidoreductase, partial [Alphaproteobacteria bacterium]